MSSALISSVRSLSDTLQKRKQSTTIFLTMGDNPHHEHLVKELAEMLKPVFENSPQAIYLYLDDEHKTCNQKFADMLGYSSIDEWIANPTPVSDVSEEDRDKVINAYGDASESFKASQVLAKFVKKDGSQSQSEIIMVPIPYKNEVFVLHLITENKHLPDL